MSFSDIDNGRGRRGGYGATSGRGTGSDGDSQYIREAQAIETNIQRIARNSKAIEDMVNRLGTNKDTEDMRTKLDRVSMQTQQLAKETAGKIKQLTSFDGGSLKENKARAGQRSKLQGDFKEVLKQFEMVARASMEKQKKTVAASRSASMKRGGGRGGRGGGYDVEAPLDERNPEKTSLLDDHQRQQQLMLDNEIEYTEAVLMEREEAIEDVAAAVEEVNGIMKDLHVLVRGQGEQIDNIESMAIKANQNTSKGVTELQSASKYQKSKRNKICILLVIILIVGGVSLLLVLPNK